MVLLLEHTPIMEKIIIRLSQIVYYAIQQLKLMKYEYLI